MAELLVARATRGWLAPNAQKSWDVLTAEGGHLQVKARVVLDPHRAGERQLSAFRSWGFDHAVIVLFDGAFVVRRAALLPVEAIRVASTFQTRTNSHRVMATDELLGAGEDWTQRLRAVVL